MRIGLQLKRTNILVHLILLPAAFAIAAPFFWILTTAFKDRTEVFSAIPRWLPGHLVLSNFAEAWAMVPFGAYYWNTVVVCFGLLAVQLVTVTLAAYAFARMKFRGNDTLFLMFLMQLMIAPQSIFVPNYLTISSLGLLDTRLAIMAPYFASAFGVFLMRQAFKSMPSELEEAALIDGCSGLQFLWRIAVPLARPSMLAFSLVSITHHWNEFFWPLLVTDTSRARTLTIGIGLFAQSAEGGAEWTLLMAATLIAVGPLIVLFLLFQRHFINSFVQSGLKE